MNTGLLWYDDDPRLDLAAKIEKARDYYLKKYGKSPNLCVVNPSMINNPLSKVGEISVKADQMIMPNHFWLGVRGLIAA